LELIVLRGDGLVILLSIFLLREAFQIKKRLARKMLTFVKKEWWLTEMPVSGESLLVGYGA